MQGQPGNKFQVAAEKSPKTSFWEAAHFRSLAAIVERTWNAGQLSEGNRIRFGSSRIQSADFQRYQRDKQPTN
jgi:hypothetical protein